MSLLNFISKNKKEKEIKKLEAFNKLFIESPENLKENYFKTGLEQLKKWGSTLLTILSPPKVISDLGLSYIKSKTLDTIEDLAMGRGLRFKYYGNYAGPGYSAGKFYTPNEIITKEDLKIKSVDFLDELTKEHDLRYQLGATFETQQQRKNALREADEIFIKDAEKLLNSRELDYKQRIATQLAIKAFKIKLKLDSGYNIDRLPEDKIKEARKVAQDYLNIIDLNEINQTNYDYETFQKNIINLNQDIEELDDINNIKNISQNQIKNFNSLTSEEKKLILDFLYEELQ